jgi:hypothetical protein
MDARQLKQELRQWEVGFSKTHGRMPTKQDIDGDPSIGKPSEYRFVFEHILKHKSTNLIETGKRRIQAVNER